MIRPASFCGVAAFKPSFGRLPVVGMKAFSWSIDTAGLFAAELDIVGADLDILLAQVLGQDTADLAVAD